MVGTAKSGAQRIDEKNLEALDFSKVTLHQAKRLEMDSQVRTVQRCVTSLRSLFKFARPRVYMGDSIHISNPAVMYSPVMKITVEIL